MQIIEVTCAIIVNEKMVLLCQLGDKSDHPFRWEFPGGKIEPDEPAERCIVREIAEELNTTFTIIKPLTPVDHHYPTKSIRLIPFLGHVDLAEIHAFEHVQIQWISFDKLDKMNLADADRLLWRINKCELSCYLS